MISPADHTRFLSQLLAIAIAAPIWAPPASAQVLYGSLVGNVTDPNGAVVSPRVVPLPREWEFGQSHVAGVVLDRKTDSGTAFL